LKFKDVGTTVRPDRAASTLVIAGPYKISRNPMYLGLALAYLGIAIAGQSVSALILLPVVLAIIQRRAIEPEEAFLEKRFGANYISYKEKVRRWLWQRCSRPCVELGKQPIARSLPFLRLGPELASLPTPCGSAIIAFAELEEMVSCDTVR
jgi:hypothetical protein